MALYTGWTPIKEIEAAAKEIAEGKLKADIAYHSKNELGVLSESIRTMIERIRFYMNEISDATNCQDRPRYSRILWDSLSSRLLMQ